MTNNCLTFKQPDLAAHRDGEGGAQEAHHSEDRGVMLLQWCTPSVGGISAQCRFENAGGKKNKNGEMSL
jgi:hypothetical protein